MGTFEISFLSAKSSHKKIYYPIDHIKYGSGNERRTAMFEAFPDVINTEELCKMLHISKNTAYILIRSGALPAKRIGRIYRIRKQDVLQFMAAS